jgi:hypothetical protein
MMGGNCLKNCEIRRMSLVEYNMTCKKVLESIKDMRGEWGYLRVAKVCRSTRSKIDFGDIDVLMVSDELPADWIEQLSKEWKSKEVVRNGPVVTFEVDGFQVDVIKTPSHEFNSAYAYLGQADCGNFMGKLSRRLGLKYGHNGLTYVYRDGDHVVGNITVSDTPAETFDLLGLNYEKFLEGFDTLEDVFEFVASSKYFSPKPFSFEEMNSIARIRDKKRPSYNALLKWIDANKATRDWNYEFADKDSYLPMLFERFPKFREEWYNLRARSYVMRDIQAKFNGDIVRDITGLQGKDLGLFMIKLRMEGGLTQDFILTQSQEKINQVIADQFKESK